MPILDLFKKYWFGIPIALIVIIAGFLIGGTLNEKDAVPADQHEKELSNRYEQLFEATKDGKDIKVYAPKKKDSRIDRIKGPAYDAASPTIGPILTTLPGEIDSASNTITINESQDALKEGQAILFFDQEGILLATERAEKIVPSEDNTHTTVTHSTHTAHVFDNKNNLALTADIVIAETGPIKRISNHGIIEEGGQYFIYLAKAEKNEHGHAIITREGEIIASEITKYPITINLYDDWHIQADMHIHKADLIILNPDENLHDGALVKIRAIDLGYNSNGPTLQVWFDEQARQRISQAEQLKELISQCSLTQAAQAKEDAKNAKNGKSSCSGGAGGCSAGGCSAAGGSGGCGAHPTEESKETEESAENVATESVEKEQSKTIDPYELLNIERPEDTEAEMSKPVTSE